MKETGGTAGVGKIRAVIFDWAGTTVDYGCFAPVQAFVEVFRHFGIEPTMDEVRAPMGMLKRDHIRTMLGMERIAKCWQEVCGRPSREEDVEALYSLFEGKLMAILEHFSDPKPYVLETVGALRERGIKIGSTTGYTDGMMAIVTRFAKEQGYRPDVWFSPDSTEGKGRPYPYMIFKNMEALEISSVDEVIKVGDTVSDIREGKNAGVLTVGIIEGSSEMGLSAEEYEALSRDERAKKVQAVTDKYMAAGADYVIMNMGELTELIEKIESGRRNIPCVLKVS